MRTATMEAALVAVDPASHIQRALRSHGDTHSILLPLLLILILLLLLLLLLLPLPGHHVCFCVELQLQLLLLLLLLPGRAVWYGSATLQVVVGVGADWEHGGECRGLRVVIEGPLRLRWLAHLSTTTTTTTAAGGIHMSGGGAGHGLAAGARLLSRCATALVGWLLALADRRQRVTGRWRK